ncbi:hypothetical protein ACA910_013265 [Epithemia clementina (nom. ined.)]
MTTTWTLFCSLSALALIAINSFAAVLQCGDPLAKDCSDDQLYQQSEANLVSQSNIWKRSGFYRVSVYDYRSDYRGDNEVVRRGDNFGYRAFVNITVQDTRYFQHAYYIQSDSGQNGKVWYREMFGHSQPYNDGEEKGDALLLSERVYGEKSGFIYYPNGVAIQADYSKIVDIGGYKSIRRTKAKVPNDETGQILTWETLTCQEDTDCSTMEFLEERFDELGNRISFTAGIYTKVDETKWIESVETAYNNNGIASEERKPVPSGCLVDGFCVSEKEWCDYGDPSCDAPQEEEDGELRDGVIASIAVLGFIVVAGAIFSLRGAVSAMIERRYRTNFISRFCEDMSLQKAMKEITSENMIREFNYIDKDGKGHITKGELLNFLLSARVLKPITDRDFSRLWQKMDLNRNGVVGYAEFCAFTADCYKEHSELRNTSMMKTKKASLGTE